MKKNALFAILAVVIAATAYLVFAEKTEPASQQAIPEEQASTAMGTTTPEPSVDKHSVTWKFDAVGEATNGATKTKVTVIWDGVSHDAGTYEGSCAEIDGSAGTLQEGEVSGALCWFAGAGDEIGIFDDNGKFVLKHGEQQEGSGEGAAFRGNFKTLLAL